jgi:hypothetical protein
MKTVDAARVKLKADREDEKGNNDRHCSWY